METDTAQMIVTTGSKREQTKEELGNVAFKSHNKSTSLDPRYDPTRFGNRYDKWRESLNLSDQEKRAFIEIINNNIMLVKSFKPMKDAIDDILQNPTKYPNILPSDTIIPLLYLSYHSRSAVTPYTYEALHYILSQYGDQLNNLNVCSISPPQFYIPHVAISQERTDILQLFVENGGNLYLRDINNISPLHLSFHMCKYKCVVFLLNNFNNTREQSVTLNSLIWIFNEVFVTRMTEIKNIFLAKNRLIMHFISLQYWYILIHIKLQILEHFLQSFIFTQFFQNSNNNNQETPMVETLKDNNFDKNFVSIILEYIIPIHTIKDIKLFLTTMSDLNPQTYSKKHKYLDTFEKNPSKYTRLIDNSQACKNRCDNIIEEQLKGYILDEFGLHLQLNSKNGIFKLGSKGKWSDIQDVDSKDWNDEELYQKYLRLSDTDNLVQFFKDVENIYVKTDVDILRQEKMKYITLAACGVGVAYICWRKFLSA